MADGRNGPTVPADSREENGCRAAAMRGMAGKRSRPCSLFRTGQAYRCIHPPVPHPVGSSKGGTPSQGSAHPPPQF